MEWKYMVGTLFVVPVYIAIIFVMRRCVIYKMSLLLQVFSNESNHNVTDYIPNPSLQQTAKNNKIPE